MNRLILPFLWFTWLGVQAQSAPSTSAVATGPVVTTGACNSVVVGAKEPITINCNISGLTPEEVERERKQYADILSSVRASGLKEDQILELEKEIKAAISRLVERPWVSVEANSAILHVNANGAAIEPWVLVINKGNAVATRVVITSRLIVNKAAIGNECAISNEDQEKYDGPPTSGLSLFKDTGYKSSVPDLSTAPMLPVNGYSLVLCARYRIPSDDLPHHTYATFFVMKKGSNSDTSITPDFGSHEVDLVPDINKWSAN